MALAAYTIWGFLPLYIALLRRVAAFELVAWRVIFTLPLCLAIVALRRQGPDLRAALSDPRTRRLLLLSAVLIGINWVIYIAAVNGGHIYAASLGYYINPLVNVLLGTIFLGETLNRRQWAAVGLAGAGVALLLFGASDTLGISLALGVTFGLYGLVRKLAPVGSVPGLTIESALLLPLAVACAAWFARGPALSSFGHERDLSLLLLGAGVLTSIPLLLFAVAARRMDYSTLGFVQFLSPTIAFVLALTVFGEPLRPVQLACFVLIWSAIALFSWDLLARRLVDKPPA
ncbi:MAG TPA: EamA family transporter RarD [Novosphingobium sp.]|nr:EamA family transporter RarD [Novosphingobium sp.]